MNRLWLGIALLLFFLALGLGTLWFLDVARQPVVTALETAAQAVLAGEPAAGAEKAAEAAVLWAERKKLLAAISPHEPMEEMEGLFAQLRVYAQQEEWTDFAACCRQLAQLMESLAEHQGCAWWSVL